MEALKNRHSGEISPGLVTLVRLYTIHTSVFTMFSPVTSGYVCLFYSYTYWFYIHFQLLFYDYLSLALLDTFYVADFSW